MSRDSEAPSTTSPQANGAASSAQPTTTTPPPTLPAHLFEIIAPLTTLLDRVLTPVPTAETAAGSTAPLAIKDFQGEVLRVKHALAAARTQLRGLPDVERSVDAQQAEFVALCQKMERARRVSEELRSRARDVLNGRGSTETVTGEGIKEEDAAMVTD